MTVNTHPADTLNIITRRHYAAAGRTPSDETRYYTTGRGTGRDLHLVVLVDGEAATVLVKEYGTEVHKLTVTAANADAVITFLEALAEAHR